MTQSRVRQKIKELLHRMPHAFNAIREVRDTFRVDSLDVVTTRFGFSFTGAQSMQVEDFAQAEAALMLKLFPRHPVFLDIGANVGFFTCLARSAGCHVLSFEPVKSNLTFLYKNIERNGWADGIEIYPIALGESPRIAVIHGARCGSSLIEGWAGGMRSHDCTSVLPLDLLLSGRFLDQQILIKIDVEGYELTVLKGAEVLLKREVSPTLIVEIYKSDITGEQQNPFLETFSYLSELGYSCFGQGETLKALSAEDIQELFARTSQPVFRNYVFSKQPELILP